MKRQDNLSLITTLVVTILMITSCTTSPNSPASAKLNYDRKTLESFWQKRLQSFLDKNQIPIIDLQSSIR